MSFFDWFSLCTVTLFVIVFTARTLALGRQGVRVFMIGIGKAGFRAAVEIGAMVLLAAYLLSVVLQALNPWWAPGFWVRTMYHAAAPRMAGVALMIFGYGLFFWGLASFGGSWRIGIDKDSPGTLITEGAFALLRNPVFTFMDMLLAGTVLVYPTWPFLVMAVVFIVGVHFHIREEENFLSGHYGAAYRDYCARVRRYGLF